MKSDEMNRRIDEFTEHRGSLYTGGIVLRAFIDFRRYGNVTNEYRAFYFRGQLLSICRNSNQPDSCPYVSHDFVDSFTELPSNYYTVDFAETSHRVWIVIETGDGQVSGLSPKQYVFKYYDDMREIQKKCGE